MSYIDSFKHEFVGFFGSFPVYHPLEDIDGGGMGGGDDFSCTTGQLVLGGGSGEHPGLVIKSPSSAVARFITYSDEFDDDDDRDYEALHHHLYDEDMLEFAGWDSSTHHGFYEMCRSDTLPYPFDEDSELGFENWFGCSIGEFIFCAMPELAPALVKEFAPRRTGKPYPKYNNILLMPPGMMSFADGGSAFVIKRQKQKSKTEQKK